VLILRLCSCSESAYAICVFHILLHMCPHTEIYVSSCYYICVLILLCALILLHMCPETAIYAPPPKNWSRLLLLRRARAGGGVGGGHCASAEAATMSTVLTAQTTVAAVRAQQTAQAPDVTVSML
jgi:hypothetical protein